MKVKRPGVVHVAGNMFLVAVNKIVVSLLPVCCIQRDTMLPRCRQHIAETSNMLPGQHVAVVNIYCA